MVNQPLNNSLLSNSEKSTLTFAVAHNRSFLGDFRNNLDPNLGLRWQLVSIKSPSFTKTCVNTSVVTYSLSNPLKVLNKSLSILRVLLNSLAVRNFHFSCPSLIDFSRQISVAENNPARLRRSLSVIHVFCFFRGDLLFYFSQAKSEFSLRWGRGDWNKLLLKSFDVLFVILSLL